MELCTWKGFSGGPVSFPTSKEKKRKSREWLVSAQSRSTGATSPPCSLQCQLEGSGVLPAFAPDAHTHFQCMFFSFRPLTDSLFFCVCSVVLISFYVSIYICMQQATSLCVQAMGWEQYLLEGLEYSSVVQHVCAQCVQGLGSNSSIATKEDRSRLFSQMAPRPGGLCL